MFYDAFETAVLETYDMHLFILKSNNWDYIVLKFCFAVNHVC